MKKKELTKNEFYELSVQTVKMNELISHHLVEHLNTDLTKIQIGLLMEIIRHQPLTITELSDRVNMNYGNTSSQCKILETKDYILRKRDEADERYVKLTISENGQVIIKQVDEWMENFLNNISSSYTEEEWEELYYTTQRFKHIVQESIQLLEGTD